MTYWALLFDSDGQMVKLHTKIKKKRQRKPASLARAVTDSDSMDKITTYSDNREQSEMNIANASETKNPLSHKEKQGKIFWSQLRDSNPGPVLYESTALPLSQVGAILETLPRAPFLPRRGMH